jgi:hypothetical protein
LGKIFVPGRNDFHFSGMIDELKIWNTALSEAEIKNEFNQQTQSWPLKSAAKAKLTPLPPVMFKGKPFFPLGAFDPASHKQIDSDFFQSGANMMVVGNICFNPESPWYNKGGQPALFVNLKRYGNNPRFKDFAFIVGLRKDILMDLGNRKRYVGNRENKILRGDVLEKHKRVLAETVKRLSKYPDIIGYNVFAPENIYYHAYIRKNKGAWEKTKDAGLARAMIKDMGWFVPVIRKEHPNALLMPVIAWYTTYKELGFLYDVNMPNSFPSRKAGEPEFAADLHKVNYDAACAVSAARRLGGGRTVVYMPRFADINKSHDYTFMPYSLKEQRYVCFAPLTRGAMGIFGWTLRRTTRKQRNNVVYPVMREVRSLADFFLGSWHDELVTSSHDTASVNYLKRYVKPGSTVKDAKGKDDNNLVETGDLVPDVSYCLRKHSDGRYLLLAVNNRRENLDRVDFRIELTNLPCEISDVLNKHSVKIDGKNFHDNFGPFEVRAYVFRASY